MNAHTLINNRLPENAELRRLIGSAEMLATLMESLGLDTDVALGHSCRLAVQMFDQALDEFRHRNPLREAA